MEIKNITWRMSVRLSFVVDRSQLLNHTPRTPQTRMNEYEVGYMLNASASATMLLATRLYSCLVSSNTERVPHGYSLQSYVEHTIPRLDIQSLSREGS